MDIVVLPFVAIPQTINLEGATLWPNTEENWKKQLGFPSVPSIMEQYRDARENPRAQRASVLTPNHDAEGGVPWAGREPLDIVAALSTASWLHDGREDADPWFFELWSLNPSGTGDPRLLHRMSKSGLFSIDSPHKLKVTPGPYCHAVELSDVGMFGNPLIPWADRLSASSDNYRQAFRQLFRFRFDNPFMFTPGSDMDLVWSAFEALFREPLPEPGADEATRRLRCLLRGALEKSRRGQALSKALKAGLRSYRRALRDASIEGKDTRVAASIISEMGPFGMRPAAEAHLRATVTRVYRLRCTHSHGGLLRHSDFEWRHGLPVYYHALAVAKYALLFRSHDRLSSDPDNSPFVRRLRTQTVRQFNSWHCSAEDFRNLFAAFANTTWRDWYPFESANHRPSNDVALQLVQLCAHAVYAPIRPNRGRAIVRQTARTVREVISRWTTTCLDGEAQETPLSALIDTYKACKKEGMSEEDLTRAIASHLEERDAHDRTSYANLSDYHTAKWYDPEGNHVADWVLLLIRLDEIQDGHARIEPPTPYEDEQLHMLDGVDDADVV